VTQGVRLLHRHHESLPGAATSEVSDALSRNILSAVYSVMHVNRISEVLYNNGEPSTTLADLLD
jgi:hypothetical protein